MSPTPRRESVLKALTEGIARLATSDRWRNWLVVQSRFHRYSFRNTVLILLQRPTASRVAGFHAWRGLGRNVRRGERAIWILAPTTRRVPEQDADDSDNTRVITGFKPVPVYDLAQTDGEELTESPCSLLTGSDVADAYGRLVTVAHSLKFSVEDTDFRDSRNGDCAHTEMRIRIARHNSPAHRVKTLAHELAHAILHKNAVDRASAELEAESVAFVVCANMGIESDEYSFAYVATWAGSGAEAIRAVTASGARIQQTADAILTGAGAEASETNAD